MMVLGKVNVGVYIVVGGEIGLRKRAIKSFAFSEERRV